MDPMWVTALHLAYLPAAFLCGYLLGAAVRKGKLGSRWLAYGLTLVPGLLLSFLVARSPHPNEQPWQGFVVWAAWAALGVVQGRRGSRRPKSLTTLNLSGKEPQETL